MFRWNCLNWAERAVLLIVIAATAAVAIRGVNAMITVDGLPDWLTTGALLGIPAGWAYITYFVSETMKLAPLAITLTTLLVVTPPARAIYLTDVIYTNGEWAQREADWVTTATIPPPDELVVVHLERCPERPAPTLANYSCARRWRGRWRIWLDPATPPERQRWMFYHELFHIRDLAEGPRFNRTRKALRAINRWRGAWWSSQWPSAHGPDLPSRPSERAADAAAWCAITPRAAWPTFDVAQIGPQDYGWRPTSEQFSATCATLRRVR